MGDFEHSLTVQVKEVLNKCREVTDTRGQPAFVDKAKDAVTRTREFGAFLQRNQREDLMPHAKVPPVLKPRRRLTELLSESSRQRWPTDPNRQQHQCLSR